MEADDYFKRGIQHYENGDCDGAISDYTKAIQSDPDYVSAWCNRGLVWRKKGDFQKVVADLDEAIRIGRILRVLDKKKTLTSAVISETGTIAELFGNLLGSGFINLQPKHNDCCKSTS